MRFYYDKKYKMLLKLLTNYSPNFSTGSRINKNIKFIVLHYTGMLSETKAIKRLSDVRSKVSCHYFIKRNGKIILMVPEKYPAWHAGKSNWGNYSNLNKYSIGIEIQNKGHEFGYQNFTKNQIRSVSIVCNYLIKKYKIKKKNILGHSDIAYERKKDPGEKFPWEYLAKKKIGNWHFLNKKKIFKLRKKKISKFNERKTLNNLRKIGYFVKSKNNKKNLKLITAFQRRFRAELVNGILDLECELIAKNLSK